MNAAVGLPTVKCLILFSLFDMSYREVVFGPYTLVVCEEGNELFYTILKV